MNSGGADFSAFVPSADSSTGASVSASVFFHYFDINLLFGDCALFGLLPLLPTLSRS
jgi:hypothetical protein